MTEPRRIVALVAVALAGLLGVAEAQGFFRISYDVDRSRPDQIKLFGQVTNDNSSEVFDVSVMAQALNPAGKVVASGITYVDSRIDRGASKRFEAVVPAVPGATQFRVRVSSYRPGYGASAP